MKLWLYSCPGTNQFWGCAWLAIFLFRNSLIKRWSCHYSRNCKLTSFRLCLAHSSWISMVFTKCKISCQLISGKNLDAWLLFKNLAKLDLLGRAQWWLPFDRAFSLQFAKVPIVGSPYPSQPTSPFRLLPAFCSIWFFETIPEHWKQVLFYFISSLQ